MSKSSIVKKDVVEFYNRQNGRTEKIRAAFLASRNEECAVCSKRMVIAAFRIEGVLDGMPPVFMCSPECVAACMQLVIEDGIKEETKNNAS